MIESALNPTQWAQLVQRFPLTTAAEAGSATVLPTRALLAPERLQRQLTQLSPLLLSPSLKVTASLLSKRVAFLTTAAAFYPLSLFDKGLDLSLENCLLDTRHDGHRWQSQLPLLSLSCSAPGSQVEREQWRDAVAERLFARHLTPLWLALSAVSGISSRILWENTAVRLFSLFEHRMEPIGAAAQRRVQRDFHYLVHEAPGVLFGLENNPLTPFFRPQTWVAERGEWVRFRRTCCFFYQASRPQEYCQSCPLLKPGNRGRGIFKTMPPCR